MFTKVQLLLLFGLQVQFLHCHDELKNLKLEDNKETSDDINVLNDAKYKDDGNVRSIGNNYRNMRTKADNGNKRIDEVQINGNKYGMTKTNNNFNKHKYNSFKEAKRFRTNNASHGKYFNDYKLQNKTRKQKSQYDIRNYNHATSQRAKSSKLDNKKRDVNNEGLKVNVQINKTKEVKSNNSPNIFQKVGNVIHNLFKTVIGFIGSLSGTTTTHYENLNIIKPTEESANTNVEITNTNIVDNKGSTVNVQTTQITTEIITTNSVATLSPTSDTTKATTQSTTSEKEIENEKLRATTETFTENATTDINKNITDTAIIKQTMHEFLHKNEFRDILSNISTSYINVLNEHIEKKIKDKISDEFQQINYKDKDINVDYGNNKGYNNTETNGTTHEKNAHKDNRESVSTIDPITTKALQHTKTSFVNIKSQTVSGNHIENGHVTNILIFYPSTNMNKNIYYVKPEMNITSVYNSTAKETSNFTDKADISTTALPTTVVKFITGSTNRSQIPITINAPEYLTESTILNWTTVDPYLVTETFSSTQLHNSINTNTQIHIPLIDTRINTENDISNSIEDSLHASKPNVTSEIETDNNTIQIGTDFTTSIEESVNTVNSTNDNSIDIDVATDGVIEFPNSSTFMTEVVPAKDYSTDRISLILNSLIKTNDTKVIANANNQLFKIKINTTTEPSTLTEYIDTESTSNTDVTTETINKSTKTLEALNANSITEHFYDMNNKSNKTSTTIDVSPEIVTSSTVEPATNENIYLNDLTAIIDDNITVTYPDITTATLDSETAGTNTLPTITIEYFNDTEGNYYLNTIIPNANEPNGYNTNYIIEPITDNLENEFITEILNSEEEIYPKGILENTNIVIMTTTTDTSLIESEFFIVSESNNTRTDLLDVTDVVEDSTGDYNTLKDSNDIELNTV